MGAGLSRPIASVKSKAWPGWDYSAFSARPGSAGGLEGARAARLRGAATLSFADDAARDGLGVAGFAVRLRVAGFDAAFTAGFSTAAVAAGVAAVFTFGEAAALAGAALAAGLTAGFAAGFAADLATGFAALTGALRAALRTTVGLDFAAAGFGVSDASPDRGAVILVRDWIRRICSRGSSIARVCA